MRTERDADGLEVLARETCLELLASGYTGRLGIVVDGRPVVTPVNYRYVGGTIFVRVGQGQKLEAARRREPVCLEVDEVDDVYHRGWSVLASGVAEVLTDPGALAAVEALALRPWIRAGRDHVVRIVPTEVSGRRL